MVMNLKGRDKETTLDFVRFPVDSVSRGLCVIELHFATFRSSTEARSFQEPTVFVREKCAYFTCSSPQQFVHSEEVILTFPKIVAKGAKAICRSLGLVPIEDWKQMQTICK